MTQRALLPDRAAAAAAVVAALAASLLALWRARDYALLGLDTFPLVLATRASSTTAFLHSLARPLFGDWMAAPYYRPVLHLSIALDHASFGLEPFGYHASSVGVFALAALALYGLARALRLGAAGALAALAFLLLHPVLGAVLPSPARRADTLCLLFTLLALTAQIRAARRGVARAWLSALLAGLAVGSKETGLAAPVLCGVAAGLFVQPTAAAGRRRSVATALVPHLLVVGIAALVRTRVLGSLSGGRPVSMHGLLTNGLATFGRLLEQSFSARAVWPDAALPIPALAGTVLLGGAAVALSGSDTRRMLLRHSTRPALLAVAWLGTLAAGYALGMTLQPWYLLMPVAAGACLVGSAADAIDRVLRGAPARSARATALVAGLCLAALLLQLGAASPLLGGDDRWQRASVRMTRYLASLEAVLADAEPGDRIRFAAPPAFVGGRPRMAGVVVLAPYTVEAWARLRFPAKNVRVARPGASPAPNEVWLALAGARGHASRRPEPPDDRPNILWIIADDLGYADLGFQGGREIATPRLDQLAREGVRFSDAYVSAPLCAPTRAGLLTGRDANRYGYATATGSFQDQMRGDVGVPPEERLLSELLRDAGYATAAVGKWHLGVRPRYRPLQRGFDEFFGILAGSHAYFDWGPGIFGPVFRGDARTQGEGYLTDAFADEAAAFLRRPHERPFFLYVAFHAVHGPLEAPARSLERYAHLEPRERQLVAAMTGVLDEGVGRILDALAESGAERDTLVVFLNDNGGLPPISRNGPLRGGKGDLFEGGIRIPLVARWPGHLAPGVYTQPVSSLDLFPTALAAAGIAPPAERPLDGVDLLPHLRDPGGEPPHDALHWRFADTSAIRRGSWKLLRGPKVDDGADVALFDLASDVGETRDLRASQPGIAAELARDLAAWSTGLGAAREGPPAARPGSEVPERP